VPGGGCDFSNLSADNRAKFEPPVNVRHIIKEMIFPDRDWFCQSGVNTGKSRAVHDYIKTQSLLPEGCPVLHITNRRSLRDGIIETYADMPEAARVLSYEDKKQMRDYKGGQSICVTLDSLHMIEKLQRRCEDPLDISKYRICVDEVHSVMVQTYLLTPVLAMNPG
jgi:hypothetical protein